MKFLKIAAALVLAAVGSGPVYAHSVSASLLPFTGIDLDGDRYSGGTGLAIEGILDVSGPWFLYGEVTRRTFSDDFQGVNFDNYRIGLAIELPNSAVYLGINLEQYRRVASGIGSSILTGGGGRIGARTPIGQSPWFFTAELAGSLFEDGVVSFEGLIGFGTYITNRASLFANYRYTYIDQNSKVVEFVAFDDVRVGIRFEF